MGGGSPREIVEIVPSVPGCPRKGCGRTRCVEGDVGEVDGGEWYMRGEGGLKRTGPSLKVCLLL